MNHPPTPDGNEPPAPEPTTPEAAPLTATTKVDKDQIVRFVTDIKNAEQQVGEHVIAALQYDHTVAVLTTVVIGPDGQQRVVSAALNQQHMAEVNKILQEAQQEREDEEPCVGFHCLIKPKPASPP